MIILDFGIVEGLFVIIFVEYVGSYNGEVIYELLMVLVGVLIFMVL